jgi:hypothetical protein
MLQHFFGQMRLSRQSFGSLPFGGVLVAAAACAQAVSNSPAADSAPRVLIVGGGSSHDYGQWFNRADSTTLAAAGAQVGYTDVPGEVLPQLTGVDVLYLSNNQPLPDPVLREAIFRHVADGKGLIIGHAGAWYNWSDWPEYYRSLIGGGARSHMDYGDFEVNVVAPDHPIMQGVPSSFTIRDELYRFVPDPAGPAMTVLATAREAATGTVHPIVWTVRSPKGRIIVNTLGHDGEAHGHPAYQRILQNSLRWASRPGSTEREP